ncbi:uncharacterized protein [Haliotis asinina]|uniref:uncharacterized protein n=1 Tax=Haliotis asinina TaxID=109174 RepID=UPI003531DC18
MAVHILVYLLHCLSIYSQYIYCENISNGKEAKQSSTWESNYAGHALNISYLRDGAMTFNGNPSWWEVDLRGYFTISYITVTARNQSAANSNLTNATVEVMDKDVSLCSDVQVVLCGNVPSVVSAGEKFTFTCNATFPVRFIRVSRRSTRDVFLTIGHVDVQGKRTVKPCCSHYTSSPNVKVSEPFLATSAVTVGDCGIVCNQHHSCIDLMCNLLQENLSDKWSTVIYRPAWKKSRFIMTPHARVGASHVVLCLSVVISCNNAAYTK